VIRGATTYDDARCIELAEIGGASGVTPDYLDFVRATGRLLMSDHDAFAGMTPVDDVAMLTDLFVAPEARGRATGTSLLDAVLDGYEQRMTFSSQHPAAVPAYRRAGMHPQWRLLYLRGVARGGDEPLSAQSWAHHRPELALHFAARPSIVTADAIVEQHPDRARVHRIDSSEPTCVAAAVLDALPAGLPVTFCVPEWHELARWLGAQGFAADEHDVFCATPGVEWPPTLACCHPGLA
jgi:GNAT superfamily N-acetyltransferase